MSTPPDGTFPEPGERIGPYEIVRRLGAGGMGVVFEAVDPALERRVALKVIAPHLAGDPTFRARFVHEAQAQASLDSPHVVPVFAHGEADGALYLASRLIPDGDLGALIAGSGPPPPRVALDLVAQVAAGLADAHATGLVHRDIKPANVLLRVRGEEVTAYLADFGIAHRDDSEHGPTARGVVGTPGYLAPEVHAGGPPGTASDLYSLGCLLWAALTGRAPYAGTTDDALACAHASAPIPQLAGAGPFDREVNRILRRAMAKHPGERYPSAGALRDDLRRVLRDHRAPSPARRTPRAVAPVLLAVVAAGLVGLVVAVGAWAPDDEQTAVDNIAAALVEGAGFGQAEADCAARALVQRTGAADLRQQGVLDEDLELVVDPDAGVDPGILATIIDVSVSCVFEPVPAAGRPVSPSAGQPSASRISPATVATYKVPSGPR
ncbi:serine/threonine-protein kinase [Nocardioides pelophilus]|uniref:serine/threonine-protein kinase n=1 Tax=Nocardioides pelophilus TaxID=2172019 RepID=UPI0016018065|nr:serine/threonine-protein kinase [Nocardioides pelophilus]